jgi:hypothetical protein
MENKLMKQQSSKSVTDQRCCLLSESAIANRRVTVGAHNQQNDNVYADIPRGKLAVERFQKVSRVVICSAISKKGKFPLIFVEAGIKFNHDHFIELVLENHLFEHACYFCFQLDYVPSNIAKRTQK